MLELLINGRQADIKETSVISITKTYENNQNPLNYYSDYSKTVKLPITRNNNAIFNNFNRLDSLVTDTTIDPKSKLPFILLNNKEPIMEGYVKLENANTIWTDEEYEITLFSTFGLIMNELKLLTFNPNAQDLDPKYVIDTPFTDVKIDRNLIKRSFEQETHSLDGDSVTDWIGFIPTYQGKYTDFASDREQLLPSGRTDDMSRERDEHYKREFRSYYQQPFIWVDKLWKAAQDKIAEITDYSLVLDNSWFFPNNPYYKDLIYTCPNIFNSGSDFKETTQVFTDKKNEVVFHRYNRSGSDRLNTIHTEYLTNLTSGSGDIYVNGVFNPDGDKGTTVFKGSFQAILFAYSKIPNGLYARITDDNPIYIKVKAVNADTNEDIFGASKTFLLYSDDTDANRWTYDKAIDLSISERGDLPATIGDRTPQYTSRDGFAWKTTLNVELNIMENVPYRICFQTWNLNNDKPFEWVNSNPVWTPTWDWVWTDFFTAETGKGYSIWIDTVGASVTTVENTRSGSNLTLYRIFPKETTLCDVLLKYSKIFGLMWKIDEDDKTVTVMTRDNFFAYSTIKDWTGKIDRSREFRFSPLCFDTRYVEFNYGEGQCGRLKKYEDYYQYTYGTKKIDTEFDFNADTNKFFDNLVPSVISQKRQYSKMMNTEYEDRPNFMGYSYMVYPDEHFVDNDDNGENAGMSGAFYFRNGTFTPDPRLSNWDSQGNYVFAVTDDTEHMIKTQEYCWNSCGENVTLCYRFPDVSTISNPYGGYRYSVHFEAPKEYFFRDGASEDIKYVYNTFWENYINERYATQNKKLTAYVYLSIDDFKELDFTEFINIDNILYHVDKVYDFNPNSNGPTKVDLTQVWDLTAYKGDGAGFPYIYTAHDRYTINDDETTITVHASGEWEIANTFTRESWLTATKNGNSLTLHATGSTVLPRMQTLRIYLSNNPTVAWTITVTQVNYIGRLNITPETLVFPETGGTRTVTVDSSNTANNAITISTSARWLSARITDYNDNSLRRNVLHMEVTAAPSIDTRTRSGSVTLTMTDGGQQYTATLHVGQQCADFHIASREDNVINGDNSIVILDRNGNRVTDLVSGETYTFEDLFPEEIDPNTLSITNGFAKISGTSGKQTVAFTPQLSDGDTAGGGVIKVKTLNGNYISYPYNVEDGSTPTPTPTSRRVTVKSDGEEGYFRISASGMEPKTTTLFDSKLNDGTVITLTAVPNDGYTFSKYVCGSSTYTTPTARFTIDSSLVTDNMILIYVYFEKAAVMGKLTVNSGTGGKVTIGSTAPAASITRSVAIGSTVTNIKAIPDTNYTFQKWSDGAISNPRDYVVNGDVAITALFSGGSVASHEITVDGTGLGRNSTIQLYLDNDLKTKTSTGETNTEQYPEGTYSMEVECTISDISSKFNSFKINSSEFFTNPYRAQTNLDRNLYITAVTIPSGIYWSNTNAVDDLMAKQSILLDFNHEDIVEKPTVPTGRESETTIAIPTDYSVEIVVNSDGEDVTGAFTVKTTDNGNWSIWYTEQSAETDDYTFSLVLA